MSANHKADAAWDDYVSQQQEEKIEKLERELNEANQRIKRLEEDSDRLHWLLKRGLAWRGCYNGHWLEGEWLYSSQDAIETIDKAKEAKL